MSKTSPVSTPALRRPAAIRRHSIAWLLVSLFTPLMLTFSFPPFYCWPLALLALAPLATVILGQPLSRRWLAWYYLLGWAYFAGNLYWLVDVSWAGYLALALYLAIYVPLFALLLRCLYDGFRLPAILAIPIAFTALEYVRCTLFSGFAWFQLGTALAPSAHLRQGADIAGVWGLTFLAAIGSGWLTDLWSAVSRSRSAVNPEPSALSSRRSAASEGDGFQHQSSAANEAATRCRSLYHNPSKSSRRAKVLAAALWRTVTLETAAVVLVFAAAWFYGAFRLHQPLLKNGPTVAVIQSSIPQKVKNSAGIAGDKKMFAGFLKLSQEAAKTHPDLIAWPETMVPGFLNRQWLELQAGDFRPGYIRRLLKLDRKIARRLVRFSRFSGCAVLVGAAAIRYNYRGQVRQMQNIAAFFTPHRGEHRHFYAKHHLVPFGEFVPFKHSWPWMHRWLLYLTPYGPKDDYTLTPGRTWRRFTLRVGSRAWRFGTPICYEDAMPHPDRMFARPRKGRKGVAFLVSISNDGWYPGQTEQEQHLQLDQIRAVEERVPIALSVNGGDSGFINSDGQVIGLVKRHGQTAWVSGWAAARLPLDARVSLFSRTGAIWPQVLVLLNILLILLLGVREFRRRGGGR